MWAVGCLMGELIDGEPMFAGDSDLDQLARIQRMQGRLTAAQEALFLRVRRAGVSTALSHPRSRERACRVLGVSPSYPMGMWYRPPDTAAAGDTDACESRERRFPPTMKRTPLVVDQHPYATVETASEDGVYTAHGTVHRPKRACFF